LKTENVKRKNKINAVTSNRDGFLLSESRITLITQTTLIVSEFKQAGSYNTIFNGAGLSDGVCFYKLEAGKFFQTKLMMMIK